MTKRKALLYGLGALALFRAVLPWGVERAVNGALSGNPGLAGRVDDVDLHVLAGRLRLEDLNLTQGTGAARAPLLSVESMDLKMRWKDLFRGAFVGELTVRRPLVSLLLDMREPAARGGSAPAPAGPEVSWREALRGLFPVKIDRFEVRDGAARLRGLEGAPGLDVLVDDVQVTAENLTNSRKLSDTLLADVEASARLMRHARFRMHMDVDPLAKKPTFNFDGRIEHLELRRLNPFFRHYAGIDVESGKLSVYAEAAAKDGKFEGYVKPLVHELNVLKSGEEKQGLGRTVKEGLVEAVGQLFDRDENDQSGSRVPFAGELSGPNVDLWAAAAAVFRNAFVKAIPAELEGSVGFKSLEE